jgi:hypothetical protein
VREERAVEVVGDDDAVEPSAAEGPGGAVFQVGDEDLDIRALEVLEAGGVPVECCDPMA